MKRIWSAKAIILMIVVFYTSLGNAQMLALKKTQGSKILHMEALDAMYRSDNYSDRHPRIISHFAKNYHISHNVKWYEITNGVVAKFNSDSIPYSVTYSQDGSWMYTIKHYAKQYVPANLSAIVNKKFSDFAILRAREIIVPNATQPVYLVQIQNGNRYKELRISNEGTHILKSFETLVR